MEEISGSLKQKYLVPYQNASDQARGILYGPNARPIVSLPVAPLGKTGPSLAVHFLVETGSPFTFLSKESLKAIYGVQDLALIESPILNIWGSKVPVILSKTEWQGINVLGADFLRRGNIALYCQYYLDLTEEYCLLKKQPAK